MEKQREKAAKRMQRKLEAKQLRETPEGQTAEPSGPSAPDET